MSKPLTLEECAYCGTPTTETNGVEPECEYCTKRELQALADEWA